MDLKKRKNFTSKKEDSTFSKRRKSKTINKRATQPAYKVPGTSPEGSLKLLTSETYRGHSGDPQGISTKTDDLNY